MTSDPSVTSAAVPARPPRGARPDARPDAHGEAWALIQRELREEFGDRTYDSWLAGIRLVAVEGEEVTLALPTRFIREWVQNNFLERLRGLWSARSLGIRAVRLVVAPERPTHGAEPVRLQPAPAQAAAELAAPVTLKPECRFDSFVTGRSNDLAYNAARMVAEGGAVPFNPLFLHSTTGLGKTHLMHAIGWEFLERRAGARVLYMTAEKFTVDFLAALHARDTIRFKQELRRADLLMIDDVQFIIGKGQTQEEFFHTVNELISAGRRLVISADRVPQDLGGLQERILSRLAGGLVADIQPADHELRLNILHAKAAALPDVKVPADVLEFLARRITSSIRELEGALNRVVATAGLTGQAVTLDLVRSALAEALRAHDRRITIDEIQRRTADYYGIKLSELLSPRRAREVARPRQVAMYLAKKLTTRSFPDIGRRFGGRDHTTVLHAVKRIEELRAVDSEMNGDVAKLMRTFEG